MGEAGRETRKGAAVEAAEPRCIYCTDPSETAEHMPPLGLSSSSWSRMTHVGGPTAMRFLSMLRHGKIWPILSSSASSSPTGRRTPTPTRPPMAPMTAAFALSLRTRWRGMRVPGNVRRIAVRSGRAYRISQSRPSHAGPGEKRGASLSGAFVGGLGPGASVGGDIANITPLKPTDSVPTGAQSSR